MKRGGITVYLSLILLVLLSLITAGLYSARQAAGRVVLASGTEQALFSVFAQYDRDLLDMYGDFKPKFVKHFAHIREEMVKGLNLFHEETLSGAFPSPEYSFNKQVEIPELD